MSERLLLVVDLLVVLVVLVVVLAWRLQVRRTAVDVDAAGGIIMAAIGRCGKVGGRIGIRMLLLQRVSPGERCRGRRRRRRRRRLLLLGRELRERRRLLAHYYWVVPVVNG